MKNIKILLVGSRYTGKGQIGRAWARTEADLPTLQPLIVYDRIIKSSTDGKEDLRVVSWIPSYEPEFSTLRTAFYKYPEPDGLILTFDLTNKIKSSFDDLLFFRTEIHRNLGKKIPEVLVGMHLKREDILSNENRRIAKDWTLRNNNIPYFELNFPNKEEFKNTVGEIFNCLLKIIL